MSAPETLTPTSALPDSTDEPVRQTSRRSFVFFGALAAAAALPKAAQAQVRSRIGRPPEPVKPTDVQGQPNESMAAFPEWQSTLGRLVRRTTLGITQAELTRATQLGYEGYLNYQLNYTRINDDLVENAVAANWPFLSQTSDALFTVDEGQVRSQLQEATIYRAAFSQRQLYHRMVEFWTDHFNQDSTKVGNLLVADQRDVIRAHALGKFPDLLKASAHSPSMMIYLDQTLSRSGAPNQNYAREIMELHTLGVDGGYKQIDVSELSRVLTGWTATGRGVFVFNAALHDWDAKTVLNVTIPKGSPSQGQAGINEGEQMLNVLASHPSTAKFIATKMLKWLLDPNPSQAQINTVAATYRATGGDIKSMIRVILNETWMTNAPPKFKRPFHFLVSSLRSANPTIAAVRALNTSLATLGHPIYTWATPDGFPDTIEYWSGNLMPRWKYSSDLANAKSTTSYAFDSTAYFAGSPAAAVDLINQNFFGSEIAAATRTALLGYLTATKFSDNLAREGVSLAVSANAFQWY